MASYARKALHGTIIVFILSLLSALAAYFFRFLLARNLSVAEYGLFFALLSFTSLLFLFKDLGIGFALVKFIPELQVARKWNRIKSLIASSFLIQFASSVIIALLIVLFAPFLMQKIFHSDQTGLLLLFAAIFVSAVPQSVFSVCMQSFQKMFFFSLQDLVRNVLLIVVTFILLSWGLGIFAPALAHIAMYLTVGIVFFFILTKVVFKQFSSSEISFAKEDFSKLLLFGLPAMLTIFGSNILQYTDTIMLTSLTNLTNAGLYQVAVPLAALVLFFANATSSVAAPLVAELLARKKHKALSEGIELLHKYLLVFVIPASAALITFPEIFIRLFFGSKFLGAAPALRVLSIGVIFYSVAQTNLSVLFGLGKPRRTTFIMLGAAAINVVLNLALIPMYGMVGAATATATSYLIILLLSSQSIRKTVDIKEPWFTWLKTIFAAAVLIGTIAFIKGALTLNPWIELCISISAGGILYCLLLFGFKIINMNELRWMLSQIGLRKSNRKD